MAARGETQANVEVSTLVVPAWRLRWRAPELALVLGERALALASARHDEPDRLRAEALVVFAGNRVGRSVRIADRAIDALKAAEAAGEHETGWLLRVELAACARSVGAPLTGFAAVTPVLEAPDVPAELRASALVQASECLVTVGRGDEPTKALAEADQLYVADTSLDEDTRLLLRGLIRAVQAAQHRRWGDIAAAIGAAREGLDLLARCVDPAADSGQGIGRLTLELVLALMDANRLLDASEVGAPMLDRPVRAPSASTSGWLRLALATRVHLPAGRVALARDMLRDAAASAERHQLDTLLAESLLALAHVHEVSSELADALTNLRAAHAAERRRARAVYAVRARLAAEFSGVHRQPADLHQQLADLLRPVEGMPRPSDGILPAALKQQLRQWRPVQVRKGDGLKVKRVRRAAEDMTVEGLSAARQHAADRWRMVQPFGDPDDKTPEALEPPPPAPPTDRTVPASGLIASAGAMVSGRRRAARVAAGEIDDDQASTVAETPAPAAPEPQGPQLTPEQERKRKVEQQLMELQREARRQIEAERQARAEQRAKAEREAQAAAEEAARQEAARQEAARQEAARQEAARQEAARQEAARQEAARQEAARQEAARQEAARQEFARQEAARQAAEREESARHEAAREAANRAEAAGREEASSTQSESVLDMLKAQGLRTGGRRRARDAEAEPETPSWRVEPPVRLRQDDSAVDPSPPPSYFPDSSNADSAADSSQSYFADPTTSATTPDSSSSQSYFADPTTSATAPDSSSSPNYFAESAAADSTRTESSSQDYFGGAHSATPDQPNYFADPSTPVSPDMPDRPTRSGLAAAFSRPPAAPDFGPHLDEPAYPLHTPAEGFPASPADLDERKLPDLDFSSLNLGSPKSQRWAGASVPSPDPAEQPDPAQEPTPLPPLPDPVPSVPTPDDIPQPPEPDLLSSTFLSSADVDDSSDLPTIPVRVQVAPEPQEPDTESDPGAYDFFASPPAQPDAAAPHDAEQSAGTEPATPSSTDEQPESGARAGRPSSRRKPSDLSLADLLAEALVAYETGRREDEEQVDAADLTTPEWSAAEPAQSEQQSHAAAQPGQSYPASQSEQPYAAGQPGPSYLAQQSEQQPNAADHPGQSYFTQQPEQPYFAEQPYLARQPEQPFLADQPDQSYLPHQPTGSEEATGSDAFFQPGHSFGEPKHAEEPAAPEPFLPEQPARPGTAPESPFNQDPLPQAAESAAEKTGPIVPVGAQDSETTGPIRPIPGTGPSNGPGNGPASWTLPGT
ncbi:hypothetical protein ACIA8G_18865 [Lentzea sp. NPDC051213]|uniref:hypothetical protein n=1 Tax=Lentzea sp. NPDC051213 TaxID=3364126 RepID=UPI003788897D